MSIISDIKQVHVKAFYADCVRAGLKRNTIKLIHNLIYSSLELAVDSDFIRKNPAKGAMEGIRQDAVKKKPLSGNEIKKLMDFCIDSSIYSIHVPFLMIAIGTCLRCGELTGLTWSDIDMRNRTISINHQLIYKNLGDGCKFHINKPKTDAGERILPMTESVYKGFMELKKQNLTLGRQSSVEVEGYSNFVFISSSGRPLTMSMVDAFLLNIEKAYNKAHPEESIPHLSAHILRHTGCTLLASAGIDIKALQNVMGHSDASITMNWGNVRTLPEYDRVSNPQDVTASAKGNGGLRHILLCRLRQRHVPAEVSDRKTAAGLLYLRQLQEAHGRLYGALYPHRLVDRRSDREFTESHQLCRKA